MKLLVILGALFVSGCVTNGYQQFYRDQTGGQPLETLPVIVSNSQPQLQQGTDPDADVRSMAENGYSMLGYSSFNGPQEDPNSALSFAKLIHADVVIVYSKYSNTVSGAMPITTPTTQTSYTTANVNAYGSGGWANAYGTGTTTTYGSQTNYVPYSVTRYDQAASFWIRSKKPIFGVRIKEMSDEKRSEIGSNQGLEIDVVMKDSPAFAGDFIRGDIIRKINGNQIGAANKYSETIGTYAGQKITIEGFRNGKPLKKTITLNERPR